MQRVAPELRLIAAVYGYREYDAPRTDQCPPPEAPVSECLEVEEQFRTLAYLSLRGSAGAAMDALDMNVSYQRHDELRVNDRPRSFTRTEYTNGVFTLGAACRARTRRFALSEQRTLRAALRRRGLPRRGRIARRAAADRPGVARGVRR